MFILFLLFWGIAYFILKNQFRTTALTWAAISIFLFGFAGLSAFLQTLPDTYANYWIVPAIAASIGMLWGPYALSIYTLYKTEKMPKTQISQKTIELLCALPLASFYFIIPAIQMFGLREPPHLQAFHTKLMTAFVTPYFIGSAILLTINLSRRVSTVWRAETITSYILVVPATITFYLTAFLIPSFGYNNLWRVNIVTIIAESALFIFLLVRNNAFGLSYNQRNATREQMGESIVEGTRVLQHALKNNLLAARLALQNAQYCYNHGQNDADDFMNNVQLAINSCRYSLSILDRIQLKIYPINLSLKYCTLLPIIQSVIDQNQAEIIGKNVQIEEDFKADPQVYCDPIHMREVILNLVSNALEAMPEDGSGNLVISLEEVKQKVLLQISDNGCGIEKDQMKHLGIPLLTQKVEGTHYGLGLYYVKKVVGMHEGQFYIKRAEGDGTTAVIVLPVIRETKR